MIPNVIERRKESERQGRTDKILYAARNIFLQKGYWRTTMRDISLEAELSTGAIYFYFKGKDEIYGRICEDIMRLTVKLLNTNRKTTGTMRERLIAIMKTYVGFYVNYKEDFDLLDTAYKQIELPEYINQRIDRLVKEALSYINEIFVDAINGGELSADTETWKLTMSVWAAIEGILYIHKRKFLAEVNINLDDIVLEQMNIFESGIKTEYGSRNV
jgi:AcrR family transcriptional regulator